VLVVANEPALRIARQRGLAGTRQAEEERRVARGPDVGRAVHGQHALQRQHVVEHGEDRLLVLAGIARARDDDLARREVERNHHVGAGAVARRIGLERGGGQNGELRLEAGEISRGGHNEEVPDEEVVPRQLLHEADREPVGRVGPGVQVLHEQLLLAQVRHHVRAQGVVLGGLHRPVDLAPPDVAGAGRLLDHELVVGRPARVGPGAADERPISRHHAFGAPDGVLVEHRRRKVDMHGLGSTNPMRLEPRTGLYRTHVCMTPGPPPVAGGI
jgi:hypothetical protein